MIQETLSKKRHLHFKHHHHLEDLLAQEESCSLIPLLNQTTFLSLSMHCLGFDHERLTYRHAGRDFRLTDVHGRVVQEIFA